jgi:RNA polymerase sigma factor (sigma-70 family)
MIEPRATDLDEATEQFAEHRELLFALAYRMLGSVADTEDVLQEAWLGWASARRDRVENPRAYLVRVTVNEALRRLDKPHRRHEMQAGPWLPEPLVTDPLAAGSRAQLADAGEAALRADAVSMALLVVLETLTPLERAVFVLREAFAFEHTEIARILDRSPAAVRQLAHRAREHVEARRPRFCVAAEQRENVTVRFIEAALGGDLQALLEVLAPEAEMWTDGGGRVRAARRVIRGRDNVVRLIGGLLARNEIPDLEIHPAGVNDDPGVVLYADGMPFGVVVTEPTADGKQIRAVYAVIDPVKLRGVAPSAGQNRAT